MNKPTAGITTAPNFEHHAIVRVLVALSSLATDVEYLRVLYRIRNGVSRGQHHANVFIFKSGTIQRAHHFSKRNVTRVHSVRGGSTGSHAFDLQAELARKAESSTPLIDFKDF